MSNYMSSNNGRTSLHAGVRVVAFAAVVGMIALAAGRGTVNPDELAAEQPRAEAQAQQAAVPTPFVARNAPSARDPSVPADEDVIANAKDVPPAPTF